MTAITTSLPNKLFTREQLKKYVLPLSVALFFISLPLNCIIEQNGDYTPGFMALTCSWLTLNTPDAIWAWFANPFILIAWLTYRRWPDISFLFGAMAFIAAASCLACNYFSNDYTTQVELISHYSWGYWFWLASCSVMFAGNIIWIAGVKKIAKSSEPVSVKERKYLGRIRTCIWIVTAGLFLSGVTAFPLETELKWLTESSAGDAIFHDWFSQVYDAIRYINMNYPYLSYGTDWLAFAHLMLAILFAGAVKDPVRNKWVIKFGIIAAFCIFPLAFIAGGVRTIPIFWELIDCSFGVVTLMLLVPCYEMINKVEALNLTKNKHTISS